MGVQQEQQTQQAAGEVLRKPENKEHVTQFVKNAPQMMAELTQQFIDRKAIGDRSKFRLQMKAVLDMISVDTEYPTPEKKDGAAKEDYSPRRYDNGGGRLVDAPDSRQNENILGGTY